MKYVFYPIAAVLIGGFAMAAIACAVAIIGFAWHRLAGLPPETSITAASFTMIALILAAASLAYARDEM